MRKTAYVIVSAIVLFILWLGVTPVMTGPGVSGVFSVAMSHAKQVGLAAMLYAQDHEGKLPETLPQLVPDYLPDATLLPGMELETPGAVLKELPVETIIVSKAVADPKRKITREVLVHADISVVLGKPAPR